MTELSANRIRSITTWQRMAAIASEQALEARIAIIDGDRRLDTQVTCNVAAHGANHAGVWSRLLLGAVEA